MFAKECFQKRNYDLVEKPERSQTASGNGGRRVVFPNGCNDGVSAAAAADVPAGSPPPGIFPAQKRERAPIGPDRPPALTQVTE